MPDDPKQIATTDPYGYVKIELNAPTGGVVTQPLMPPPPVPPPFQPMTAVMATTNPASPPERESQQKLEQAQQEIQQGQKQQQETEQKLQELKKLSDGSSKTIAGYKPSDIFQAFVKPPRPSLNSGSSTSSMDKEVQQQLEMQSKEMKQELSQTQKRVQQANKQIGQAQKQAEKTNKKQGNMLQNIIKLIDSLQGKAEQTSKMAKAYLPFMVLGLLFLLIAILTLLFAKSNLWVLIAMAALVQLGLSGMLKKRSQ